MPQTYFWDKSKLYVCIAITIEHIALKYRYVLDFVAIEEKNNNIDV